LKDASMKRDEFNQLSPDEQVAVLSVVREMERQDIIKNPSLMTKTLEELYDMSFTPKIPIIDGLLCCGTYIFAGSPKIGKSFLMAQIAHHVATGTPLWDFPVMEGTALYLALEDDYSRLQSRFNQMFGVESIKGLHLAVQAQTIDNGLLAQMEEFVKLHPDTRLIIVDTLQKVRQMSSETYSYAMDYQNITTLKQFSDCHSLAIIVVHHTRKMEASDSFDMISGTNGLLGAADGAFILTKKKRTDPTAVMQVVGRDQPDQELTLRFDQEHLLWLLVKTETVKLDVAVQPIVLKIKEFMDDKESWEGTASELLELIPGLEMKPNVLTRNLNANSSMLAGKFGIIYQVNPRKTDKRTFTLSRKNNFKTVTMTEKNDDYRGV